MASQTFFLQINDGSVHVAQNALELPQPRPKSHWQRYQLTLTDGALVELVKTDSLIPTPRTEYWSHRQQPKQVSIGSAYIMMGKGWRDGRVNDKAVKKLLDIMRETVPI